MTISLGSSIWLLLLCMAAAGGLTYWMYQQTTPPISRGRRLLLGGLRFLALAIVLFLLFEPIVRQFSEDTRPPVLAVLADDSQSLRVTAGDDTSATPLRTAVQHLRESGLDGELRFFAFGQSLRALPADAPADSLRADAPRTDIAAALDGIRDELQDVNLKGIALLSDGQYNTGRNPLYGADRSSVPIHTIAVGDTTRRRDLQVRRITTNDIAYVDTELPIQVGLRAESVDGERVRVSLMRDGEEISTTQTRLPTGTAEVPVELTYTPSSTGLQRLEVQVTQLENEVTYRNNQRVFTVQVLESKRRLLVLGAAPSPNFASTRRLLSRVQNVEVVPFVSRQDGSFYQGTLPDDLSDFDALVLAGFPSSAVPMSTIERVAEATAELSLLFLMDRQTDPRRLRQHFGDRLPVAIEQPRSSFIAAQVRPSEQYRQHPILNVPDEAQGLWEQLPPLQYNETRWTPSPDARVLATANIRSVELSDPMLVIRSRSGSRSAALLATDTWRWTNLPPDLDAASELWPALLSNMLEWVATREDTRSVRVRPVQETFGGGQPVEFSGQVYDESLNPVNDASVTVNVIAPDSTRYPYDMNAVGNGRYVLEIGSLPEGTYRYVAEAQQGGAPLGTDEGQFAVGALTLEFQDTRANATLLRQIAYRSGGSFVPADRIGDLMDELSGSDTFTPQVIEQESDVKLWHMSSLLIVVILLLGAEWILRKRSGMA